MLQRAGLFIYINYRILLLGLVPILDKDMNLITNFKELIPINGRLVQFSFSMQSGHVREKYKIVTINPDSEFFMHNWVDNGYILQYQDIDSLPDWVNADDALQRKLNEAILKTWPKG